MLGAMTDDCIGCVVEQLRDEYALCSLAVSCKALGAHVRHQMVRSYGALAYSYTDAMLLHVPTARALYRWCVWLHAEGEM